MQTDPHTDFWRRTHDHAIRDSGHFRFRTVSGDFCMEAKVAGAYRDQYDQAGLMVRENERTWLKAGIELKDGQQYASTVVTRDWSDWSVVPVGAPPAVWLRVQRTDATIETWYSVDGHTFQMMRQAFLTESPRLEVGCMAASPSGFGFVVTFTDWRLLT